MRRFPRPPSLLLPVSPFFLTALPRLLSLLPCLPPPSRETCGLRRAQSVVCGRTLASECAAVCSLFEPSPCVFHVSSYALPRPLAHTRPSHAPEPRVIPYSRGECRRVVFGTRAVCREGVEGEAAGERGGVTDCLGFILARRLLGCGGGDQCAQITSSVCVCVWFSLPVCVCVAVVRRLVVVGVTTTPASL